MPYVPRLPPSPILYLWIQLIYLDNKQGIQSKTYQETILVGVMIPLKN